MAGRFRCRPRHGSAGSAGNLLALHRLLAGLGQGRFVTLVPELVAVGIRVARAGSGARLHQHQLAAVMDQGDGAGAIVETRGETLFATLERALDDAFVDRAGHGRIELGAGGIASGYRRRIAGRGRCDAGFGGRLSRFRVALARRQRHHHQQRGDGMDGSVHAERSWPLWRPSAISSTSLEQKAGRSSGVRLVTRPWSTTTSRSTQRAPAFSRSRWMFCTEVSSRLPTTSAFTSTQGPWQIAPTGLPAWKKARVKRTALSSARRASGLNRPPGITRAS